MKYRLILLMFFAIFIALSAFAQKQNDLFNIDQKLTRQLIAKNSENGIPVAIKITNDSAMRSLAGEFQLWCRIDTTLTGKSFVFSSQTVHLAAKDFNAGVVVCYVPIKIKNYYQHALIDLNLYIANVNKVFFDISSCEMMIPKD